VKQKDQNSILQEFYSPEFVVFAEEETTKEKTLTEILKMKPEKKNQILENIRKVSPIALRAVSHSFLPLPPPTNNES
jgi:hypothetical protein